ncbi:hypothetical protein VFPPC_15510 [Pochonia chlamydosporia 170]|uniref:Uncharacterized protein n=1 Tax=Pochonia chlamydosporia 170 TaxID=1380566 RepID=A0A179FW99_METCM|nr:hypothetical protein VFPPC_15510 [Pochonia chlamydosporia 170]OAQ69936.1 hypothetical protein VFPPC_15510 [Pochonia chlamydosporia 170]
MHSGTTGISLNMQFIIHDYKSETYITVPLSPKSDRALPITRFLQPRHLKLASSTGKSVQRTFSITAGSSHHASIINNEAHNPLTAAPPRNLIP